MKTDNEKPLWQIARDAYFTSQNPYNAPNWGNVSDAVIAEHERRKATAILHPDYLTGPDGNGYGVGTGATYNSPPKSVTEGQAALTTAMADPKAECKAAFKAGKRIQCRDDKKPWMDCDSTPCWFHDVEYRVHPDDVEPEPFAAEKAAHAQGKRIQYFSKSSLEWLDCDRCPPSWLPHYAYRVKPEPVLVPLGPDDVKCGDLMTSNPNDRVTMVIGINPHCILVGIFEYSFEKLLDSGFLINRNDGKGWVACSKEAKP